MYGKGSEGDRQRDSSVYSFFFHKNKNK
jgi:hypothetical protein